MSKEREAILDATSQPDHQDNDYNQDDPQELFEVPLEDHQEAQWSGVSHQDLGSGTPVQENETSPQEWNQVSHSDQGKKKKGKNKGKTKTKKKPPSVCASPFAFGAKIARKLTGTPSPKKGSPESTSTHGDVEQGGNKDPQEHMDPEEMYPKDGAKHD